MEIEEFEDLIDRCGEKPADWPASLRDEAVRFLAGSPRAQELVAEAAALRAAFDGPPVRAPAGLADRIAAMADASDAPAPQPPFRRRRFLREGSMPWAALRHVVRNARNPSFMLALVFAFGLTLGLLSGVLSQSPQIDFATLFAVVNS